MLREDSELNFNVAARRPAGAEADQSTDSEGPPPVKQPFRKPCRRPVHPLSPKDPGGCAEGGKREDDKHKHNNKHKQ